MRLSPERLLVLRAVADAGGVVAAGRRLHLAPSGISQHLAALERETGLVLLDRSQRGGQRSVRLTAAGERLAGHAAQLAAVLAEAEADVQALTARIEGLVRISAFPTTLRPVVAPAVHQLAQDHPAVTVRIVELDEQPALDAVLSGGLDLALVEEDGSRRHTPRRGTQVRWLLDDPYRLAVPEDWTRPADVYDLADQPWIDGPEGSAVWRVLGRLRRTTGLPLPAAHSCTEFPAALSLVDAGLGVSLVPDLALAYAVPDGVRIVDLPGLGVRSIGALHRAGQPMRPAVGALLGTLAEAVDAAQA